jgi:hypothetical protein
MTTTPADMNAAETQPLGEMTPAQLARYALHAWALTADQIHELHSEYDALVSSSPLNSNVDSGDHVGHQSYLTRRAQYLANIKQAQQRMAWWLTIAQTAADVANLPDGSEAELEPVTLAGYDLAAARGWFERMRARGEGSEPLRPGERAAARWRIMSPDQRAATVAIMQETLVVAAEL